MQNKIKSYVQASIETKQKIVEDSTLITALETAANALITCARSNKKVYCCGNGGSACDAMHFTEELLARYKKDRAGIKAQHFLDPGTLTCWTNDYDYSTVFSRQAETLCEQGDILFAFSTSGKSENINNAIIAANEKGATTIGFLGKGGGEAKDLCNIAIVVPSDATERIQEAHITFVHILCEIVEDTLF
ncbi:MAG: SIS domain-containing protein [Deltaproteobacteria bacterium]|nr:SIS domain-containing protein [Deltaproteobacteria bacterium]